MIRKNALRLTAQEKKDFKEALQVMKNTQSDYVALKNSFGLDAEDPERFVNISVYDFFTFMHFFATKSPEMNGKPPPCLNLTDLFFGQITTLDFAHNGPGFLTWHRLFLLQFERELQRASGDLNMALPCWDWSDHATNCSVCTNDLGGEMVEADSSGRLAQTSGFRDWTLPCPQDDYTEDCFIVKCDLGQPKQYLWRLPRVGEGATLPDVDQIKFTLSRRAYDAVPYDILAPVASFRNCLEGFVGQAGFLFQTSLAMMHAQVRYGLNVIHTVLLKANFQCIWLKIMELLLYTGSEYCRLLQTYVCKMCDNSSYIYFANCQYSKYVNEMQMTLNLIL